MEKFIDGIDETVLGKDVKQSMLKAKSFRRVFVQAVESTGIGSYITNTFDTYLSTVAPEKVVEKMQKEGFSLITVQGEFRFQHVDGVENEMSQKDIVYFLLDKLAE